MTIIIEQKNQVNSVSLVCIASPSPVLLVVLDILVETSGDLMIVVVYEQHIAVLLVMMIVDSISTGDVYIAKGVLYTTMVNR